MTPWSISGFVFTRRKIPVQNKCVHLQVKNKDKQTHMHNIYFNRHPFTWYIFYVHRFNNVHNGNGKLEFRLRYSVVEIKAWSLSNVQRYVRLGQIALSWNTLCLSRWYKSDAMMFTQWYKHKTISQTYALHMQLQNQLRQYIHANVIHIWSFDNNYWSMLG